MELLMGHGGEKTAKLTRSLDLFYIFIHTLRIFIRDCTLYIMRDTWRKLDL
jgi:hypothetical protein